MQEVTEQLTAKLFGERLRQMREAKGLSLREFASQIPLSHGALDRYELGKRLPSDDALQIIAKGLGEPFYKLQEILFECQALALLRSSGNLSSSSVDQVMRYIRFAREEDRKAKREREAG
ncbi:MAG: helix-turn-helix domain-containing protein [Chloroflexi bacterium]|nr:helix-turn-helix domain-containing protein [Chloroflexota bacterium]MDA8188066.1 helix-turn-helix transcriptional regulator [Dehalococcoidales bacterium]